MTRREFIGGVGATAVAAVSPAWAGERTWGGWQKGHFQVHVINAEGGEQMFWIMPDGTSLLLDCGSDRNVAEYVLRVNPSGRSVDYLMVTHYHADHVGMPNKYNRSLNWPKPDRYDYHATGIGRAAGKLVFRKALDRSWPTWKDPLPVMGWCEKYRDHVEKVYRWLGARDGLKVETFRLGATDQIVPMRDPSACTGFSVRNVCVNGRFAAKDGTVVDVYRKFIDEAHPKTLNENAMSSGVIVTYGKFRFYTAGDVSDIVRWPKGKAFEIESELAKCVEPCQVAKLNHHASAKQGNPPDFIKALSAKVWLNQTLNRHHLAPEFCERLTDRTLYPGDRVICPNRFLDERLAQERDRPYMKDIAPESFGKGGHVVIDVPPGGATFTVTYLVSEDDSMRIKGVRSFES